MIVPIINAHFTILFHSAKFKSYIIVGQCKVLSGRVVTDSSTFNLCDCGFKVQGQLYMTLAVKRSLKDKI